MSSSGDHPQPLTMFHEDPSENTTSEDSAPADESKTTRNRRSRGQVDISVKEYLDFLKSAYQLYEHSDGTDDADEVDWNGLLQTKVFRYILENGAVAALKGSDAGESANDDLDCKDRKKDSSSSSSRKNSIVSVRRKSLSNRQESNPEGNVVEALLRSKLNDVLGEGILDSILPYLVGSSKAARSSGGHQPIIKKQSGLTSAADLKKGASFSGFSAERDPKEKPGMPPRDRMGRRKSSISLEKTQTKLEGDVEIHVCDEVKGVKREFRCPQRLLVAKMGYFADVTAGQRLDDMDISVHCDIHIFDWLMRWVKKDSILAADHPQLDPANVIPILVSASFLQMEPLLHDCLIYCHGHLNDIVKSSTNLACINDTLLTRLAAMYTNSELEEIKDKKDKIQSRLFCKMIMSLCEPVPETIRGHYSSMATLFKCSKCSKLLNRHIANYVPCQPSSMTIDSRGNVLSCHARDQNWNISDYIARLQSELRSWRRVYWRLWGESHFFKCSVCNNYFPVYQTEWCCYHPDSPQFFGLDPQRGSTLPLGRYPCCGERAYRFEVLTHNTGCQFHDHMPDMTGEHDSAILLLYNTFKELISMAPPQLMFPERLSRLVARDPTDDTGRLPCKESFWWDGLSLAPPRAPLGLLGKLYSGGSPPKNIPAAAGTNAVNPGPTVTSSKGKKEPEKQPPVETAVSSINGSKRSTPVRSATLKTSDQEDKASEGASKEVPAPVSSDSEDSETTSSSSSVGSGDNSPSSVGEEEEAASCRGNGGKTAVGGRRGKHLYSDGNRRRVWRNGRQWASSLSARSNQDQQRRFEERATRNMKNTLARKTLPGVTTVAPSPGSALKSKNTPTAPNYIPPGGIYSRLEAEWRETFCPTTPACQLRSRNAFSAKAIRNKFAKN